MRRWGHDVAPDRGYRRRGGQEPRDIAGDHVDFEVHLLPGLRLAEIGAGERVRDDVDAKAVPRHLVDGQADPVEAHRAFGGDKRHQRVRRLEAEAHRFGFGPPLDDPSQPVDMAGDEMAAQFVAEAQRLFEIDRGSGDPAADRRAGQGLGRGLRGEGAVLDRDHRQARARTRDRGADRDRRGVEAGGDGQFGERALLDPPHPSEIGDDAGVHVVRLRVSAQDLPAAFRRRAGAMRGARPASPARPRRR